MASSNPHVAETASPDAFNEWAREAGFAFEEAAAALDLEPWMVERFRHPGEETIAYLPLIRDSGDAVTVPLFQVQHSAIHGATIGSISLLPDLQLPQCEAIAMERSWQAALLGLPLGGASYGLVCDPQELSERELMRTLSLAGRHLHKAPAAGSLLFPGRGCRREFAAKLFAEGRSHCQLTVAGTPDCLGGVDIDRAAAEGIAAIVSSALVQVGKGGPTARIAIEGFGSLGQAVSQTLAGEGFSLVALSDNSGAIYRSDGLILDDVRARFAREQVLFGYDKAEHISRWELSHVRADVLVLTSGPGAIHTAAGNGGAGRIVVEAEWNAVAPSATEAMTASGVLVVPWLVAGCGALLGSYLESRNVGLWSSGKELPARVRACMTQVSGTVLKYAGERDVAFGSAARQCAIERASQCARSCGTEY